MNSDDYPKSDHTPFTLRSRDGKMYSTGCFSFSSLWLAEPGAEIVVSFGVWTRNIPPARMNLILRGNGSMRILSLVGVGALALPDLDGGRAQ
jgi:hypothetical protein